MVKKIVEDTDKRKKKRVSISISEEAHAELAELGKFGETYDDIIRRLLQDAKQRGFI